MAENQQQQNVVVNPVNQPVNNDGNNVPINQVQVIQGADGAIALKVEQTKLPEFWGQKEKNSIAPNELAKMMDDHHASVQG
jgi:hypothetical protein